MQHQSKPRDGTSKDVGSGPPVIDNGKCDTYLVHYRIGNWLFRFHDPQEVHQWMLIFQLGTTKPGTSARQGVRPFLPVKSKVQLMISQIPLTESRSIICIYKCHVLYKGKYDSNAQAQISHPSMASSSDSSP